ncbi:hypothetical protein BUALT_Bualt06G0038400 [Buddleja alternifolia]|uniref:Uncharacterized protein n=1 Tax=Buddleja alternifolia TaxID=168488 RepID=A0AAV6XCR0_9LAMI|nr:hypothetical protein BUALT_Bualt06G0038400 [Buddleja alternifolia]
MKHEAAGEDLNNNYHQGSDIFIAHRTTFGHAMSRRVGANGGHHGVSGGDANGGSSHSPFVQGGAGVLPVYAAGGGNNHHNYHHSGVNPDYSPIGTATLAITTMAWFLL